MGILGKFGLDHCDLPTMIENLAILFRGLTININKNNIRRLEPMLETPNYEIATALMIPAIISGVFIMAEIAIFVVVIVGYIEAQMLALSDEILHLWTDSELFCEKFVEKNNNVDITDENIIKNIFIKSQLKDIVKFHMMNINLRNAVEKKFRIIYFVEIIFILCAIVAELLGGLENTYVQVPYTFHQIFFNCWISQKLLDASIVFERALYSSHWENFDVANQKTILLMLQNSQNRLTLSAGGIAVLNYPFLMYVMRFTYSTYTTLQTTVNQKNR
ncbi:unnamed protein product, partial [Brenthis ino]